MNQIPIKHYKRKLESGKIIIASALQIAIESDQGTEADIDRFMSENIAKLGKILATAKIASKPVDDLKDS